MQAIFETILFVLFAFLGIGLYMNMLYKHLIRKTESPIHSKKIVWNILIRLILLLLAIVALAVLRQLYSVPQWVLYICIAAFTIVFVMTLKQIRSHLED